MTTKRQFVASCIFAAGAIGAQGCSFGKGGSEYMDAAQRIWRHTEGDAGGDASLMHELVRYATLAPSSHNTQCWRFRLADRAVSILPDFARRCPIVDPDDHHLFVSLGCAAENLIQAAAAFGFHGNATFTSGASLSVDVTLEPKKAARSALFDAIPVRQSTRIAFDGHALTNEELRLLEKAGTGTGVEVRLLTDRRAMEAVLEFVVRGNSAQMRDPAFVRELSKWIRFSDAEAVSSGDGLFSRSSGHPSLPRWLGSLLFGIFFTEKAENDKYARHVRSSAGIAVFVSEANDKAHWVETGRAFERFALQAAAIGVRNAHLNQPVELPEVRSQFSEFLGLKTGRADLVIRFGRGPEMPRSLRRPLEAVLV